MSATDSSRTNRLLLCGWSASAAVNLVLMFYLPGGETVPFHLVWIGLSIVYGFTTWRPLHMWLVLGTVAVTTGAILFHHARIGAIGWEEITEVPLMSAVFVVMVWHVHRKQQALAEVARLADSERRRAETQRLFVRFASHELRTPITVARGYTELVRNASGDSAIAEDTEIVLEELDKLARITQRLVTLMQIDGPYARRMTDVDAELARVMRRWEPTAERDWSVRSTIGQAAVNQERLEAALDCLLENAVKFTAPGDRIAMIGSTTHDGWTITVSDSGVGITAEQAAALTAADAPLGGTDHSGSAGSHPGGPATVAASGTGLGLAIARAVVTSWGGRIQLSGEPGVGTRVTLHFPRGRVDQFPRESVPTSAMLGV